jgi:hypothetical protein
MRCVEKPGFAKTAVDEIPPISSRTSIGDERCAIEPSELKSSPLGGPAREVPGIYPGTTNHCGINESGTITASYGDVVNGNSAFLRDANDTFTTFSVPGANPYVGATWAYSISSAGAVTGFYIDANMQTHGFVRGPKGKIVIFDAPGADLNPGIQPQSISSARPITGSYFGAKDAHGFIRTPKLGTIVSSSKPIRTPLGVHFARLRLCAGSLVRQSAGARIIWRAVIARARCAWPTEMAERGSATKRRETRFSPHYAECCGPKSAKHCRGKRFDLWRSLELESQKGNPD